MVVAFLRTTFRGERFGFGGTVYDSLFAWHSVVFSWPIVADVVFYSF